MDVRDLPLPTAILDHYVDAGIEELYPPQVAAVEAGVTEGERVVAAFPTASGKTLVAQLAMLTDEAPALYVVPLRALATEKYAAFDALPGVDVGLSTGDFDAPAADLAAHDVVVATSEKVDSAIRSGDAWVRNLGCVVVDEVHLLDEPGRGPTLEMTLAKLRRASPDLQVVALSATVANPDAVADWLDAELVESDWRPVDLRTGVYDGGRVTFEDGATRAIPPDDDGEDPAVTLVRDAVEAGGGCLVFVNARRRTRDLARTLVEADLAGLPSGDDAATGIRETATTGTGEALADCVADGVAFHHAGLRSEHRAAVEQAFRERDVGVIVATPTLAAGVNVPARRVVVRDHRRFTDDGMAPLPVLEVQQMFGRAGRPGLDPYGEAVVVAGDADPGALQERYVGADPEPVDSHLAEESALRTHVLATVAGGLADSRAALDDVLGETFHAHEHGPHTLAAATDSVLADLADAGMLRRTAPNGDDDATDLAATDLGALVSKVYVDPRTGTAVVDRLRRAADLSRVTSLTVLELVCDTPDMRSSYVRNEEAGRLTEFAMRHDAELTKSVTDFDGDFQAWLGALKTARLLDDWIHGADPGEVSERYGVGPGDLRRLTERAEWLLTATESLAEHLESDLEGTIRSVRTGLGEREA